MGEKLVHKLPHNHPHHHVPVSKMYLQGMEKNNAVAVLISDRRLVCEKKHLAEVQLVTVWWWWHCSPFQPPQPRWEVQRAAVQVTVTYKHTVPDDWAEMTLSSSLPVAISLNTYSNDKVQWQTSILIPLSAFLWADKEARGREYFCYCCSDKHEEPQKYSFGNNFFVLKKTQDALP